MSRTAFAYPPTGTTTVVTTASTLAPRRNLRSTGDYSVGLGLLRFDTAALPDDAIITGARLELYVLVRNNTDNRTLVGEFHPTSAWPIAAGSYTDVAPTQNLAFGVAVGSLSPGQVVQIVMDAALADQQVSRSATTGLRLHISGGQPSGTNSVEVVTQDDPTRPEPCLVLDYVQPTPTATPTATATGTATATVSASATSTETATPTLPVAPSDTPTGGASDTPTVTPTSEPSPTATVTPTSSPSQSPTLTPTPTSTAVATQQRFCELLSADDGGVGRIALTYPPAGTTSVNTTASILVPRRMLRSTGDYNVGVGLLRFDTAALPDDATITGARLELYVAVRNDADNRNLVGEFHPTSAWPIAAGSYTDVAPTQNLAFGVAVGSLSQGQVVQIVMDAALADQQVSRSATTGLRLHISGGQPSGTNSVEVVTQDDPTRPEPCLVLDYVQPTPTATPTATATGTATATDSASATSTETATPTLPVAPSETPTSGATDTPTLTPTSEPSPTPTVTPTSSPSPPPTLTPTPTSTAVATQQQFCELLSADDGGVGRIALTYPPAGSTSVNTIASTLAPRRTLRSTGDYNVGVGLLRFDTAALPDDAVITAARLEVYVATRNNADSRNLVGEFHPTSAWPIAAGSYTDVAPTQNLAFGVAVGSLSPGQVVQITVDAALADQQVSRSASTGLRLHISGGQPSGTNSVEVVAQDDPTRPEPCLVLDYVAAPPGPTLTPTDTDTATPTRTPTATPAPGTPIDPRLLGAVTVVFTPNATNSTYRLRVACPEVSATEDVDLKVDEPTQPPLGGTIVLASGFTGTFLWETYALEASRVVAEFRAAGFRTVQLDWASSWYRGSPASYAGFSRLACRPATVVEWIHQNLRDPGTAFCAAGHSNGAAQLAYGMTHYGLADLFSTVVLDGGPNWARVDQSCLHDDPAYQSLWLSSGPRAAFDPAFGFFANDGPCFNQDIAFRDGFLDTSLAYPNYQYVYPNTKVNFVFGELDTSSTRFQGEVYHDRLVQAGSPFVARDVIPGGGHAAAGTVAGADLLRDILISECVLP